MKKASKEETEMRDHYDFRGGVRGKYAAQFTEGSTVLVLLEPAVAAAFPTAEAVNRALSALLELTETTRRLTRRPKARSQRLAKVAPS